MTALLLRTAGLAIHAIANFLLINWLFRYDITGSWLSFFGFIILGFLLLYLFIRHLVAYIYFIKTKTK